MDEQVAHKIFVEMRVLDESSQRELAAYRKLGSLKEIKALKYKESLRKQRRYKSLKFLDSFMMGILLATMLFSILCIAAVCA